MIKKSFIILCTSMLIWTGVVQAENFPPLTNTVVQDSDKTMDPSSVKQLSDIVSKLPEKYKVVIVSDTGSLTTQEYANQLFAAYKLPDNEILIVFNKDKSEAAVHAGTSFSNKGLSEKTIHDEINNTFVPYAKQQSYMTGLSTLAQQLSDTVKNGGNVSTPTDQAITPSNQKQGSGGLPFWLYLLSGILVLAASFGIYAYVKRRKLFREMDELEDWMESLENKLDHLREEAMSQQTGKEASFLTLIEQIKKDLLPDAEFNLLEAETKCDHLQFSKAFSQLQLTRNQLDEIDQEISQAKNKLFQSKVTLEECSHLAAEIRKACPLVERKLDEARLNFGIPFHHLREKLQIAEQAIEGSPEEADVEPAIYLEWLKEQKQLLIDILKQIEHYPALKEDLFVNLRVDLEQFRSGLLEMIQDGYRLPLEEFEVELAEMNNKLHSLQQSMGNGELEGITEGVDGIKERLDFLYDQMEDLVTKKNLVLHYLKELPEWLHNLDEERKQLRAELEELSLRYRVQEGKIFNYYLELQKVCKEVGDQLYFIHQMDSENDLDLIHSVDALANIEQRVESFLTTREGAYQELEELRKGEYEAQDTVMALHADIVRVEQQIRRANLPGVPVIMTDMIQEGKKSLFEIEMALNQVPLDLMQINNLVKKAKEFNSKLIHHAESIFYYCQKAEEMIQMTNRFRSQWQDVRILLGDAEHAFRESDFERAFSLANQAHERAMERMEGSGRLNLRKRKA
jgi:septation ring formation regulator